MRFILDRSVVATALLVFPARVPAHHSGAMFDLEAEISLDGVVTRYEWANPHVYLYVAAQTDTGDPVVWTVEHGPTTAMTRSGWSRDTFAAGDRVTLIVNPAKDRARAMARTLVVQRGGATLFDMRNLVQTLNRAAPATAKAMDLSGTWGVLYEAVFSRFDNASSLPLTEKGAAAVASYREETMNPQVECMARTAPSIMVFPGLQQIEIGDGLVWLRSEYDAVERTVHMDMSTHDGAAYTHQGHSIGWWEGAVLVVDTTHFTDHRIGNAEALPSGSQKHLVERFELNPDGLSLTYRFELDDPEYLAEPVMGEVRWAYRPNLEFAPEPCDLENARRFVGD